MLEARKQDIALGMIHAYNSPQLVYYTFIYFVSKALLYSQLQRCLKCEPIALVNPTFK